MRCIRKSKDMKRLIISILYITVAYSATAQDAYESVLARIEANSTALKALSGQMEAQKLGNRTGIYLANPEVEFNYLWGSPVAIGNRTDLRVIQSFDFPTAYGYRNQISELENTNAELAYKSERINLLLSAKRICIELIYYNALAKEYEGRLANARQIALVYKTKLDLGDANIIESNNAQLNLAAVQSEADRIDTERAMLLSELKSLNGGGEIAFIQSSFIYTPLPENFDDWYLQAEARSPALQYLSGQIKIGEEQIRLNRALGLPKFYAGYMSEKIVGQQHQGVSVGISVPIWENKNRVRQARTQARAAESVLEDNKMRFYNRLQSLYQRSRNLEESILRYRNTLSQYSNGALLRKALDSGEIALLDYLMEVKYYYAAFDTLLQAEKDLELSKAELSAVEL